MDIIVTTPKSEMKNAALESAECIAELGGWYFRILATKPNICNRDKVFYVEDGFVRGFALLDRMTVEDTGATVCLVTGRVYNRKACTLWMNSKSWKWIKPVPMKGFQGWRYAKDLKCEVVGGWLEPKP